MCSHRWHLQIETPVPPDLNLNIIPARRKANHFLLHFLWIHTYFSFYRLLLPRRGLCCFTKWRCLVEKSSWCFTRFMGWINALWKLLTYISKHIIEDACSLEIYLTAGCYETIISLLFDDFDWQLVIEELNDPFLLYVKETLDFN